MPFISLDQIKNSLQQTGKYWIAFTGDSLTSCEWVHPNWRDIVIYVLHCEATKALDGDWKTAEWGVKGFNFAYDGATTADVLNKVGEMLIVRPQLVISLMGGNDPLFSITPTESVKNIAAFVHKVSELGTQIVWASSTPAGKGSSKNVEYKPYADAFNTLSGSDNFFKIDMFQLYQKFPTEKFFTFISEENPVEGIKAGDADLQHPNQLGNAYIAKVILSEVFDIQFDPEKYIAETLAGEKLPGY